MQFRSLIRELGDYATVAVSTHLVEDVGAACSNVALMADGKIVFRRTPADLTARGERQAWPPSAPGGRGGAAVDPRPWPFRFCGWHRSSRA